MLFYFKDLNNYKNDINPANSLSASFFLGNSSVNLIENLYDVYLNSEFEFVSELNSNKHFVGVEG